MKVTPARIDVQNLSEEQKVFMFDLMSTYYVNTDRSSFDKDLEDKNWVLALLENESGKIVGFSTQQFFSDEVNGEAFNVLFSGDTIVAREYWGNGYLSLVFSELMLDLLGKHPDKPLYWLLISKGLRTYKYLPSYFIEYYPKWDLETPEEIRQIMYKLGKRKFNEYYDPNSGIVKARAMGQYLKEKYQPTIQEEKPYESFFFRMNPGYVKGDELLCLTRLSINNIKPDVLTSLSNIE